MRSIRKVVVLGANGAMGAGAGAVFAAAGLPTWFLARTLDKAVTGCARAEQLTKGRAARAITCGTYDADLPRALADADLVFEAVAEDAAIKRHALARVDCLLSQSPAFPLVATGTSGLSIAELCADRSDRLRRNFLGMHLFNPPTVITGCELVPHAGTDPGAVALARDFLANVLDREAIETRDTPAFAGNRLGFKVLNEVAQLAEEHGVAFMDQLVGPHTGRALPPLATIDLVGWDVHKAIVDHIHARTHDVAHDSFRLPAYMQRGIDAGHLGRKTRDRGGFFRLEGKGPDARQLALDPATLQYRPIDRTAPTPACVERMKAALHAGRHAAAMDVLCTSESREAALLRRVILGYISYGLGLVGEVVKRPRDIDRIMGFGFHWAPPGVLVDAIGAARTIGLLERARLPVPASIVEAATHERPLFDEPSVDSGRFFVVAA